MGVGNQTVNFGKLVIEGLAVANQTVIVLVGLALALFKSWLSDYLKL